MERWKAMQRGKLNGEGRDRHAGLQLGGALYIGGPKAKIAFRISALQLLEQGKAKYVVENKGAV